MPSAHRKARCARTAAAHPHLTRGRALRIINGRIGVIGFAVPVGAPFPHVAVHVVQAPGVGRKLPTGAVNAKPSWPATANCCHFSQFCMQSASKTLAAVSSVAGSSPLSSACGCRRGRHTPTRPRWAAGMFCPPCGSARPPLLSRPARLH